MIWVGPNEGGKLIHSILADLKNIREQDVLILCADDLNDFTDTIGAVFLFPKMQSCTINQLRANMKYNIIKIGSLIQHN